VKTFVGQVKTFVGQVHFQSTCLGANELKTNSGPGYSLDKNANQIVIRPFLGK